MKKISQLVQFYLHHKADRDQAILSILSAEETLLSKLETHSDTFLVGHDLAVLKAELEESIQSLNSELKDTEIHSGGSHA